MKSCIWRLAGVGVLCLGVGAHAFAEEPGTDNPQRQRGNPGGEGRPAGHERGADAAAQPRRESPPRQENQPPRPARDESRGDNGQRHDSRDRGQWQARPQADPNGQARPAPQAQAPSNLPIQGRPDSVSQTQEPRRGNYADIPRRNGYPNWQGDNHGRPDPGRPGNSYARPDDRRWPGRPGGHGNGWGPGPQYRPGHMIDRFPERNWRVPYRGQDYFFSGGYWYRPQGPRYVVVAPPRGIRVNYLPDYAREVWVGGTLLFLAAGAYYLYQQDTQDYVVVDPPAALPQPVPAPSGNGYDVTAYPANGQSPQQVWQDGEDCRNWAIQQSGFDPSRASYAPAPEVVQAYRQVQGNCLSSRGYRVSD